MPQDKITLFTASSCAPCLEVEDLIKEGRIDFDGEIELVDVETEQGFEIFDREVLSHSDGAVPSVYRNGKRCVIKIEDDPEDGKRIIFDCSKDDLSSNPTD